MSDVGRFTRLLVRGRGRANIGLGLEGAGLRREEMGIKKVSLAERYPCSRRHLYLRFVEEATRNVRQRCRVLLLSATNFIM